MKRCIYCGSNIYGRSDKKFCNYNCKSNYNNNKYKLLYNKYVKNKDILRINKNLKYIYINNLFFTIKIILIFTYICKIFSNFGILNKNKK